MDYAIIAAGEGSRLREEGVCEPKPLVPIAGVPLIERLIRIFERQDADSITVIVNEEMCEVQDFLARLKVSVPFEVIVKSTPSSMHSFFELSDRLTGDKFCLTTVDTIFREEEFADYIHTFQQSTAEGLMAVTDYIDDEKPLYVRVDQPSMTILDFLDRSSTDPYISGGIYGLTRPALDTLRHCMEQGVSRMRNYQRALVCDGLRLQAYPFSKILDIDHAGDIMKAEAFLSQTSYRLAAIRRDPVFSPNSEAKDAIIFDAVVDRLQADGHRVTVFSESEFMQSQGVYERIFSMGRRPELLVCLREREQQGAKVINPSFGVQQCSRTRFSRQLNAHQVPTCRFWVIDPAARDTHPAFVYPLWVKRGNGYTLKQTDITFVRDDSEMNDALWAYAAEGVDELVVCEHLEGDLVKFYGVEGTDFFYWFYPDREGHSKFGYEQVNGLARGYAFDEEGLRTICSDAAKALDLIVYGGDCIVSPEGRVRVIDMNDWPSFSPCREEAADYITLRITE